MAHWKENATALLRGCERVVAGAGFVTYLQDYPGVKGDSGGALLNWKSLKTKDIRIR
jgi:hypothetical protein